MFAILHFLSLLQSELTSHLMLGLQQFYKTFNTHRYTLQWKDCFNINQKSAFVVKASGNLKRRRTL